MKNKLYTFIDGIRIVLNGWKRRIIGGKKYEGDIITICRSIIEDSFNKDFEYFMVSRGNFKQFYSRDFGMVCESLLKLGYTDKVRKTLIYALYKFRKHGSITTHITSFGVPVNFPCYSPESAAYILHSLLLLNDKELIRRNKQFFEHIAKKIFENDIDKETGLLKKEKFFSEMKDHSKKKSSCYTNCMLGMFVRDLEKIGIKSYLSRYDYKETIKKYFWKGEYFVDDLSSNNIISGDANTFPFWTGLFSDEGMMKKALKSIQKKGLDKPFPLKYTSKEDVPKKFNYGDLLVPGYERDSIWVHLAMCFFKVVEKTDRKLLKLYLKQYESLIAEHKNFFELYEADGSPFKRFLFVADEGLIWVSIFLELYLRN